jgi:hypothetical protein
MKNVLSNGLQLQEEIIGLHIQMHEYAVYIL